MDLLWPETCWSTFKYFIILIVSKYYILCISWIIKCLIIIDARCEHESYKGILSSEVVLPPVLELRSRWAEWWAPFRSFLTPVERSPRHPLNITMCGINNSFAPVWNPSLHPRLSIPLPEPYQQHPFALSLRIFFPPLITVMFAFSHTQITVMHKKI